MFGYTGNILRINLTTQSISAIATGDYEAWGGGHGIGSAIFFDLVADKTISCFDPDNVVTIMTSPLSGTLTPGCAGRTEVQGIGAQPYPVEWFTRSGFGGRFAATLKFAGWDGIVIEGASETPVWIDIRNDDVQIRDCAELSLWGTDIKACQQAVWGYVAGSDGYDAWYSPDSATDARTTQKPAVVAIGPAGENLSRTACLVHDAANASGQGGFGAVWGSKKLKAISVIGTQGIKICDPNALMQARLDQVRKYAFRFDDPKSTGSPNNFQSPPGQGVVWELIPFFKTRGGKRPVACIGCHSGCRRRYENGIGNEAVCSEAAFYLDAQSRELIYRATDLLNRYGINSLEAYYSLHYIKDLSRQGIVGPGKAIDCPLDFSDYGSMAFIDQFLKMLACGNDGLGNPSEFGAAVSQGIVRAAKKWGRLDEDLATGLLPYPYWGNPIHMDPRAQLEWGYGTILGDRDINEHCITRLKYFSDGQYFGTKKPPITPEEAVAVVTGKMVPYQDDMLMLDFSTENMYSGHIAKLVAWHRHYTRFYKESLLFCDSRWPDFVNPYAPGCIGSTGEAEPLFYNAVTGGNLTFEGGIELGRKIWNLDNAIWSLQGRHRDMVQFSEYIYTTPFKTISKDWLGRESGRWTYISANGRNVDKEKFEEFKTAYYELEGWDTATGYPTRSTLADLDLDTVADELEANNRLGQE